MTVAVCPGSCVNVIPALLRARNIFLASTGPLTTMGVPFADDGMVGIAAVVVVIGACFVFSSCLFAALLSLQDSCTSPAAAVASAAAVEKDVAEVSDTARKLFSFFWLLPHSDGC